MVKKKSAPEKLLTQVELELMNVLWRQGPSTVHAVQEGLPAHRDLAYTSVSTVLRILEQKGFVAAEKQGRGHTYAPLVEKAAYESTTLQDVVARVFEESPSKLVRRLIEVGDLSKDDLKEIQTLLEERL